MTAESKQLNSLRNISPDVKRYLLLLYGSGANLLSFAGYTKKSVYKATMGNKQEKLIDYTT